MMKRKCNVTGVRSRFSQLITKVDYENRVARFTVYDEIRACNPDAAPEQVEADVAAALRAVREDNCRTFYPPLRAFRTRMTASAF
jgi:hypothetical protein